MRMAQIRAATESDCEAIARLAGQLGYPTTLDEARGRLNRVLSTPEDSVLVAEDKGLVVGWIGISIPRCVESDPFVEIMGLVVHESQRDQGIGQELIRAAESWARSRGIKRVRVRSNVIRERAHRIYERLGYSRTKQQVVFDKHLNGSITS